jgi:hypothetical protein
MYHCAVPWKPAEIDAKAAEIAVAADGKPDWHPLAVPQFLNRYAWWLDISQKFVEADAPGRPAI